MAVLSFKRRSDGYKIFTITCVRQCVIIGRKAFAPGLTKRGAFGQNLVFGWLGLNFECKKVVEEQNICLSRIAGNEEIH